MDGNIGCDSQKFLNQGAILHTFELVSENIDYLGKNAKAEPHRWILHKFGRASSDGEMNTTLSYHKNEAASTFVETCGLTERIKISIVIGVREELNIDRIDLLRANCEGCE